MFALFFNGKSCLLKEESAREMVKPIENFTWTGLGVFMGGENEIKSQGIILIHVVMDVLSFILSFLFYRL